MTRRFRRSLGAAALGALAALGLVACSEDQGSAEELCAAVRADGSIARTFAGFDPTDVEPALEQLRAARVTLGELRDAAPAEVRPDLTVEIDYVQALIEGLEAADARRADAAELVATVQAITAQHDGVADAAANLAAFADRSC